MTDPVADSTSSPVIPKYSRYRSVRRAARMKAGQNSSAETEESPVVEREQAAEVQGSEEKEEEASQKREDLEKVEAELEVVAPKEPVLSRREKFSLFTRKIGTTKTPPTQPLVAPDKIGPPIMRATTQKYVQIRCKESSINLPVTPETTPLDLILSSANLMSQDISVSYSILLESYDRLGLKRRLRHYEHVQNIVDSWDENQQNTLVIQNSDPPQYDRNLDFGYAPKLAPKDLTVYMYYSQRPGKWSKRYVTLLSIGQIFISKKPLAKLGDKDVVNICHLSDFDIYTPTPKQMKEVLKVPKKTCHAIKSQKKPNMLLKSENFVHYFSTDNEDLAERWHGAVQQWRSWYLVYQLGKGKAGPNQTIERLVSNTTSAETSNAVNVSVDETPYATGMFPPHVDLDRFRSPANVEMAGGNLEEENYSRQVPFHLRYGGGILPPNQNKESQEGFAASASLRRSSTQRHQNHRELNSESPTDRVFVEAPGSLFHTGSFMSSGHSSPVFTKPATQSETSGLIRRSGSQQHRPLLDLTPTFKEAPQWDMSKKGRGVKGIRGVPLIELATGPRDQYGDLDGMPGTVFRRD